MLPEVSVRNRKIYKTPVRSQLKQYAISGYWVQERLSETAIVQEKASRMTPLMRQKDVGFGTGAKWRLPSDSKREDKAAWTSYREV